MSLTTDRNNPELHEKDFNNQNKAYLILSEEERAKGYVRPVRQKYKHVGLKPPSTLRGLTDEEKEEYSKYGYVAFESYSEERLPVTGRFWTQEQLDSRGCRTVTTMALPLAETYAVNPTFYGRTFCSYCCEHYPVAEFVWVDSDTGKATDEIVGS